MNWNYISGFFDADGSIQLNKIHKNQLPSPVITFHNNEKELLISIRDYILYELDITGSLVVKRKDGYRDQFELRYTYFTKVLSILQKMRTYHPRKKKRILLVQEYSLLSRRNGKYTPKELAAIEKLLKQWE
ncbi:MAG: LAGLIDADG family homing endonuclease [Bacteroidota bacterium]